MKKEVVYIEPADFFPKEIRKKYGLGEYYKEDGDKKDDLKKRKNHPDETEKLKATE